MMSGSAAGSTSRVGRVRKAPASKEVEEVNETVTQLKEGAGQRSNTPQCSPMKKNANKRRKVGVEGGSTLQKKQKTDKGVTGVGNEATAATKAAKEAKEATEATRKAAKEAREATRKAAKAAIEAKAAKDKEAKAAKDKEAKAAKAKAKEKEKKLEKLKKQQAVEFASRVKCSETLKSVEHTATSRTSSTTEMAQQLHDTLSQATNDIEQSLETEGKERTGQLMVACPLSNLTEILNASTRAAELLQQSTRESPLLIPSKARERLTKGKLTTVRLTLMHALLQHFLQPVTLLKKDGAARDAKKEEGKLFKMLTRIGSFDTQFYERSGLPSPQGLISTGKQALSCQVTNSLSACKAEKCDLKCKKHASLASLLLDFELKDFDKSERRSARSKEAGASEIKTYLPWACLCSEGSNCAQPHLHQLEEFQVISTDDIFGSLDTAHEKSTGTFGSTTATKGSSSMVSSANISNTSLSLHTTTKESDSMELSTSNDPSSLLLSSPPPLPSSPDYVQDINLEVKRASALRKVASPNTRAFSKGSMEICLLTLRNSNNFIQTRASANQKSARIVKKITNNK
jgi:hypothetical protein